MHNTSIYVYLDIPSIASNLHYLYYVVITFFVKVLFFLATLINTYYIRDCCMFVGSVNLYSETLFGYASILKPSFR
jgi:hypothetical protein